MSYELARAAIIGIIKSVVPGGGNILGQGPAFTHAEIADERSTARVPRSFYLWRNAGSPRGYFSSQLSHEETVDLDVRFFYSGIPGSALDLLMEQDRKSITDALLDVSQWNRPTSGIVNLATSGLNLMPFRVEAVAGGWQQTISFPARYR